MKNLLPYLLSFLAFASCHSNEASYQMMFPEKPGVPGTIQREHDSLLAAISALAAQNDSVGRAAAKLHQLMAHHFAEEEDYVLPPLALLPQLADGKMPEGAAGIIVLTNKFRTQLAHMNAEHQLIGAYLKEMVDADTSGRHPGTVLLQTAVHHHALMEETVLFPAALLVGRQLEASRRQADKRPGATAATAWP